MQDHNRSFNYFTAILALCFNFPNTFFKSVTMSSFWLRPPTLHHTTFSNGPDYVGRWQRATFKFFFFLLQGTSIGSCSTPIGRHKLGAVNIHVYQPLIPVHLSLWNLPCDFEPSANEDVLWLLATLTACDLNLNYFRPPRVRIIE